MEKVAILIPTRNRPHELAVLLESITKSSILPKQVVIVASGDDVALIATKFSKLLDITYLHTEIKGQIAQKRIGVELVRDEIDWCLFLDDDLVLEKFSIELALNTARIYWKKNVIGIGLSLPPLSRAINLSRSNQRFLKLFKLFSSQPGKVLSSGHAVSYLQEKEVIETQWLNGLSMWRVRFARHYGKNLPSTPYAACEDLIFSYPLSKVGTLLYVPEARAAFQSHEKSKFDSIEVLRAASLWRYYFVTHNNELSFKWFYFSQIPRSIFAIRKTKDGKTRLFFGLITLNLKILYNYIRKGSPVILLNELRN